MTRRLAGKVRMGAGEDGFALISALMAMLLFAFFAYAVLAADRGAMAALGAQLQRARMEAAADAALATVVSGLGEPDNKRWPVDGHARTLDVDGLEVSAAVEDERGKIPINRLKPEQVHRLLEAVGVSGGRLDRLADSLSDWLDGGLRPNGATALDYAAAGVRQRGGPIRTSGELIEVKDMDPALLAAFAPSLTIFTDNAGPFEARTATPLAVRVMTTDANNPDAIIQAREQSGEHTKLDAGPPASYVGHPLTVRIAVQSPEGGSLQRAFVIEMTGQSSYPVRTRAIY